jgi:hypothetical protein
MAEHTCSHCDWPGRRLEYVSDHAWVDYYRCDRCHQVWSSEKHPQNVTIRVVAAPEPDRRKRPS